MSDPQVPDATRRLLAGIDVDPQQRPATKLIMHAGHGVWVHKLAGWPQYFQPADGSSGSGAASVDWQRLREDLRADDEAWAAFGRWAESFSARAATEDEYEARLALMVPARPWHGASRSELVLLRLALELAPGGLLSDGLARLDPANVTAVIAAIAELVTPEARELS